MLNIGDTIRGTLNSYKIVKILEENSIYVARRNHTGYCENSENIGVKRARCVIIKLSKDHHEYYYRKEVECYEMMKCGTLLDKFSVMIDGSRMNAIVLVRYPETISSFIDKSSQSCKLLRLYLGIGAKLMHVLARLHTFGIAHLDIKPANIALTHSYDAIMRGANFEVVLIDYEHASTKKYHGYIGTQGYESPELLTHVAHTCTADVWPAGIVVYQLLTGDHPFDEPNNSLELMCAIEETFGAMGSKTRSIYGMNIAPSRRAGARTFEPLVEIYGKRRARILYKLWRTCLAYDNRPSASACEAFLGSILNKGE